MTSPFLFLSLPLELRLDIYSQCNAFTLLMVSHTCLTTYLEINTRPSIHRSSQGVQIYRGTRNRGRAATSTGRWSSIYNQIYLRRAKRKIREACADSPFRKYRSPGKMQQIPLCVPLIDSLSTHRERLLFIKLYGVGGCGLALGADPFGCCDVCFEVDGMEKMFDDEYFGGVRDWENGDQHWCNMCLENYSGRDKRQRHCDCQSCVEDRIRAEVTEEEMKARKKPCRCNECLAEIVRKQKQENRTRASAGKSGYRNPGTN
ncbi:hypothetical protein BJ508DRAFT_134015 [Ascobolus immersus RN42]|uniref:F-box domain-containing protein n=1 Tax=Ascobolus immersus RN42 TaxID=1160509 RepID=A0A3N4IJY8_ASCIM|nr:hypothetical protein BJ508DRAFT_134015 [Ascobolus immersus RN42]